MITDLFTVTCPSCCESFGIALPPPEEVPSEVDYDCEVCCHPLVVRFFLEEGEITAHASGLAE